MPDPVIGYNIMEKYGAGHSVVTTPSLSDHARRRRAWDRAFTPAALATYTPMLYERLRQLLKALDNELATFSSPSCTVDLARWVDFFAKDFMGSFAFGGQFEFMTEGDPKGYDKVIKDGVRFSELFGTIPWVRGILSALPVPPLELVQAATQVGRLRKARGTVVKDLFYYVLDEESNSSSEGYLSHGRPMDDGTLGMESLLAIVAGSDTTVSAITCTIAYLMSNPDDMTRLRAEIDVKAAGFDDDDFLDAETLANMPFLQAVL